MRKKEYDNELHPGITMHKIPVKAGFAGLLFTIGVMLACLMGIPAIISFFALAILLGFGVAVMLRFIPRQAGWVIFALTSAMIVCLAVIPSVNEWRHEAEKDLKDLSAWILVPPPAPPEEGELRVYRCDCDKLKQPCDSKHRRSPQHGPRSALDGTWEGQMNDLPGVTLIIADAGGGQIGGVVTFYLQTRDDEHSPWHVAGKYAAPLLVAHMEGKTLMFEVQQHKIHSSPEFGPNARFRMELSGDHKALLYNLSAPAMGPSRLMRQG
jgi:hypothetical protein